jgi:hypothetical protein
MKYKIIFLVFLSVGLIFIVCRHSFDASSQSKTILNEPSLSDFKEEPLTDFKETALKNLLEKNNSVSFLLPVNHLFDPKNIQSKITLKVEIPVDFTLASTKKGPNRNTWKFIPKTDSVDSLYEIIIVECLTGESKSAPLIINAIISKIAPTYGVILDHKALSHKGYEESSVLMSYKWKGRNEVLFVICYSGPYDCSGIHYAIALNDVMTEKKAVEKIVAFIKKNVSFADEKLTASYERVC